MYGKKHMAITNSVNQIGRDFLRSLPAEFICSRSLTSKYKLIVTVGRINVNVATQMEVTLQSLEKKMRDIETKRLAFC